MQVNMLTRARQHFNNDMVSREVNRANIRKWVRSLRHLGDKWILATPVKRLKCVYEPAECKNTPRYNGLRNNESSIKYADLTP